MSLKFSEKAHRYWMDGKPVRGATTLIGNGIPKPALMPWACKLIAEWVEANPLEIERLRASENRYELVNTLKGLPNQKRDTAGLRGTAIHDMGEKYLAGLEIEIPEEHESEVMGLARFIEDMKLVPMIVEKSLGNREHWYSGRVDFIGTSPFLNDGEPVLIDWKTSNNVYGDTALQCAAYARAEFWVTDEDPDTEHPMPDIAATYVAHITSSGVYLHPLAANQVEIDKHFTDFLHAAHTAKNAETRKGYLGEPIYTPEGFKK
ncbi:hypothetical protein IDM48_04290 [Rothia amarae]|uniref:PD-(D/E)XK nuclease family protein n=1 Tax=Rothia amarae TaxID=169480 RepID=A0A7H2BLT2_9MICC|nr:hypothetical protein [Rothia amarae]QNV40628.1 hypothetical protein IDM48_04290 [Rothia amarae]